MLPGTYASGINQTLKFILFIHHLWTRQGALRGIELVTGVLVSRRYCYSFSILIFLGSPWLTSVTLDLRVL